MSLKNNSRFIGRVAAKLMEHGLKELDNGGVLFNLNLPVDERVFKKATGEYEDETSWIPLVMFGKLAENFLKVVGPKPGATVIFDARYSSRKTDDGKYYHNFIVQNWEVVTWPPKDGASESQESQEVPEDGPEEEDFPF